MFRTITLPDGGKEGPMYVQTTACFPVTYAERRHSPRRRPARETVCRLYAPDGEPLGTGLVWNLSRTGVSLLVEGRLEPGTPLEAVLTGPGAAGSLRVGLRVVHAGRLRTGDHVLGGQFDRPLDGDELAPFVM
jgi:hypothetical protein